VIYHGTRHLPLVMRTGVLLPASAGDAAVFFSRSPEVAAYWGNMTGETRDLSDGGVLVLNRSTLVQNYRLLASRYLEDWNDEREEVVWGRRINIRRHLLGVVRQADVDAAIGPPRQPVLPDGFYTWPEVRRQAFWRREARLAADLVRDGAIESSGDHCSAAGDHPFEPAETDQGRALTAAANRPVAENFSIRPYGRRRRAQHG
jgi:hypothetical protein